MKILHASPTTVHWGYFDAALRPVAQVGNGEALQVRTVSGFPDDPVPPGWMPAEIPAIHAHVADRGPGPHILTGPVLIRGARPGAVLQVDLLSVRLTTPYAYNIVAPQRGLFPDAIDSWERRVIPIDMVTGIATVPPGVPVRTRPFFGVMGVAPPPQWGRIDSLAPRRHGGNLDNKELVAGATLFLPVWVDGALFSIGDGHAAQGDGEVNVTAIETSLEADLWFKVREDFTLSLPIAVTPTHLITMGFNPDLDRAVQIAVGVLLDLLERHCGVAWKDAYLLASAAADVRVTQVVNTVKGAHVMLERALIRSFDRHPPFLL